MKKHAAILMLTGLTVAALADNPEVDSTYFHPSASLYIQGNTAAASNLVVQGLARFPDDGKLKALEELIKKQQQQNQQQQNENQKNQDQQEQDQQDQQQNQEQEQNQEQNQDQQDQNQNQQHSPDADQADQQNQQQPEPQRAEQMNQDEAERLLDAMKQEEKNKRLELHPVMGRPVKVEKDW